MFFFFLCMKVFSYWKMFFPTTVNNFFTLLVLSCTFKVLRMPFAIYIYLERGRKQYFDFCNFYETVFRWHLHTVWNYDFWQYNLMHKMKRVSALNSVLILRHSMWSKEYLSINWGKMLWKFEAMGLSFHSCSISFWMDNHIAGESS